MFKRKNSDNTSTFEDLTQERNRLERQVADLEKDLETLKHKKKIEEEDIKHMVRLKEERQEVEFQKRVLEIEAEKAQEIAAVKDDYRNKLEVRLQTEVDNIKEMYGQILERLPDVNMRIKA